MCTRSAFLPVWLKIDYVDINCYKLFCIKIITESALRRSAVTLKYLR